MTPNRLEPDELHDLDLVHTLSPVLATTVDDQKIRLGTLWEDQVAVLFFLRHFG